MTLSEYLDPERFPLTTRRGLSARGQLLADASAYQQMKELLEEGEPMDGRQLVRWSELQEKVRHHARLAAELGRGH